MIHWTLEEARALAPDAASLKAAEKLLLPAKWLGLSRAENLLWGQCKGSGKSPYDVCLDTQARRGRCSCPSRKQPCKHVVALAQLSVSAEMLFSPSELPEKLAEKMASQRSDASKAPQKKYKAPELTPEEEALQQERYDRRRFEQIAQGIEELELWLQDLFRQGLAQINPKTRDSATHLVARLVDTQAPALGRRVARLGQLLEQSASHTPHWPAQCAEVLGQIGLLMQGFYRFASFERDVQADIKAQLGWPQRRKDVEHLQAATESWWVIGQIQQQDKDLTARRSWVYALDSQSLGLVLDFNFRGQGYPAHYQRGAIYRAAGKYFPASVPLRLILQDPELEHADAQTLSAAFPEARESLQELLHCWSEQLAKNPWLEQWPSLLAEVQIFDCAGRYWVQDAQGCRLPAALNPLDYWRFQALSGGRPLSLFVEWNGRYLRPLSAFYAQNFAHVQAPDAESMAPELPALPFALSQTLLLGENRSPWEQPPSEPWALMGSAMEGPEGPLGIRDFHRALACWGLFQRAGLNWLDAPRAALSERGGQRAVPTAPQGRQDDTAEQSEKIVYALSQSVAERLLQEPAPMVCEILAEIQLRQRVLPPAVLPEVLNCLAEHPCSLDVQRLIGAAGRELVAQHSTWLRFAPAESVQYDWSLLKADPSLLISWQESAPERALNCLKAHWSEATTALKLKLLAQLKAISENEDFFESQLDAARQPLREGAAQQLAQMPGSRYVQRMTQRAQELLRYHKGCVEVRLPKTGAMSLDWARDGINITGRQLSGSERKKMLFALLRSLPLAFWRRQLPELSDLEIWQAILKGKQTAVISAFLQSCLNHAQDREVQALIFALLKAHFRQESLLPSQLEAYTGSRTQTLGPRDLFQVLTRFQQWELVELCLSQEGELFTDTFSDCVQALSSPLPLPLSEGVWAAYLARCQRILRQSQDPDYSPEALSAAVHRQLAFYWAPESLAGVQRTVLTLLEWFEALLFHPGTWAEYGLTDRDIQALRAASSAARQTQKELKKLVEISRLREQYRKEVLG